MPAERGPLRGLAAPQTRASDGLLQALISYRERGEMSLQMSPVRRDVHCETVLTRFYFGPKGEEGAGRRFWLTQADRPLYHCCRRGCCLLLLLAGL